MCGRYVLDRTTADLISLFDIDVIGDNLQEPSWNVAPTELISVVIDSLPRATVPDDFPEPVRRIEAARWGLVPSHSRGPSSSPPLFNARSEEAGTKASFRDAVLRRRSVIPASGYYEWRVVDGAKVPHFISLPGDELMLFAGLYEWWRNPAAVDDASRWLLSATILTRSSSGPPARIHDRMPVFLDADLVEEWLDPQEEGSQEFVDRVSAAAVEVADRAVFHEVGSAVGTAGNNGAQLIAAIGPAGSPPA